MRARLAEFCFVLGCLALSACDSSGGSAPAAQDQAPLTDISTDLAAVLENGELPGACDRYREQAENRRLLLLCGKYMFFYESFDTPGVPRPIMQTLLDNLAGVTGEAFSRLGYIPDPYSEAGLPLGFGPTFSNGSVASDAFTCAACHFGRAPDGSYVVGLGNHQLEYGKHLLMLMVVPNLVLGGGTYEPPVLALVQPWLDELTADRARMEALRQDVIDMGLELIASGGDLNGGLGEIRPETPSLWASWQPGVLDFFSSPFPEDEYHIPLRIPSLWEIPDAAEVSELGLRHAMLTAAGGGDSLWNFVRGFVMTSGGDFERWDDDAIRPLVEYIYSLRHPVYEELVGELDRRLVGRGQQLFRSQGCGDCHDGKAWGGSDIFYFGPETTGSRAVDTDSTLRYFSDPDLDGQICCDLELIGNSELTRGLKAPHLSGIWAHRRFLHNGSLQSLEELLCRGPGRPPSSDSEGMRNTGHYFGCELEAADKDALLAFLRSL